MNLFDLIKLNIKVEQREVDIALNLQLLHTIAVARQEKPFMRIMGYNKAGLVSLVPNTIKGWLCKIAVII